MKYAIFSDIHGNIHALKAALSDAETQGADMYLMLGDYYRDFPWLNEVVDTLRGLSHAVIIGGNNEGYLSGLREQDQAKWNREQFRLMYWNFRALTRENLAYLIALPETAAVLDNECEIHLAHSLPIFFRTPPIKAFHSASFRALMEKTPFTHEEYLQFARDALLARPDALADIKALPKGIYLFGHNHLQFHMEYEGSLFINPGSCGEACDYDPTAAYTLLARVGDDWEVTERRVIYDVNLVAKELRKASLTSEAPFWSKVIERGLLTGKDYFGPFVTHVAETGRKFNQNTMPVTNDVWDVAVNTWKAD